MSSPCWTRSATAGLFGRVFAAYRRRLAAEAFLDSDVPVSGQFCFQLRHAEHPAKKSGPTNFATQNAPAEKNNKPRQNSWITTLACSAGGPKNEDKKRCRVRGRHGRPPQSPLDADAMEGVDAGPARLGVSVGRYHLTWIGCRAFSAFFDGNASTSGPYFGGRNLTPKTGGQLEHHFALPFRCLMTSVLGVRFRPPK